MHALRVLRLPAKLSRRTALGAFLAAVSKVVAAALIPACCSATWLSKAICFFLKALNL